MPPGTALLLPSPTKAGGTVANSTVIKYTKQVRSHRRDVLTIHTLKSLLISPVPTAFPPETSLSKLISSNFELPVFFFLPQLKTIWTVSPQVPRQFIFILLVYSLPFVLAFPLWSPSSFYPSSHPLQQFCFTTAFPCHLWATPQSLLLLQCNKLSLLAQNNRENILSPLQGTVSLISHQNNCVTTLRNRVSCHFCSVPEAAPKSELQGHFICYFSKRAILNPNHTATQAVGTYESSVAKGTTLPHFLFYKI